MCWENGANSRAGVFSPVVSLAEQTPEGGTEVAHQEPPERTQRGEISGSAARDEGGRGGGHEGKVEV